MYKAITGVLASRAARDMAEGRLGLLYQVLDRKALFCI